MEKKFLRHWMRKRRAGFTLVEAIVVVGIAVMLTTILLVYTRSSEKQVIFFKEQARLVNAFFRAKAFAIETFQPQLEPGLPVNPALPRLCGWGVHLSRTDNRYIIFRDLADSSGVCSPNPQYDNPNPNSSEDFEIVELDTNVIGITCLVLNAVPGTPCGIGGPSQIDIIFVPPDPKVVFHPVVAGASEAIIALELADGSRYSEIRINRAGQISFE